MSMPSTPGSDSFEAATAGEDIAPPPTAGRSREWAGDGGLVPVVEPQVDPQLAARLVAAAQEHLGQPALLARVGVTDLGGASSGSYTALVVGETLLAVAETRLQGGEWQPLVVQTMRRASVIQVAVSAAEAWLVVDVVAVEARHSGMLIDGPAVSVPASTRACEVLPW